MRVAIFTAFHPASGGGGANVRNLVAGCPDVDFSWFYLSQSQQEPLLPAHITPVRCGTSFVELAPAAAVPRAAALALGYTTKTVAHSLAMLKADRADVFWVVCHNEGILVARELARQGHPVHISIHDDPAWGIFARSRRYRFLARSFDRRFQEAITSVSSVDVVTPSMQERYRSRFGVSATLVQRYVPWKVPQTQSAKELGLCVGHIGNVYALGPLAAFCRTLRDTAAQRGAPWRLLLISPPPAIADALQEYRDNVATTPPMREDEAIAALSRCNFLYALYPFEPRFAVFRSTSLPTKVSTYVLAARPIFAHTPADSSLAELTTRLEIGSVCSSFDPAAIRGSIESCLAHPATLKQFEIATISLFGYDNISRLRECFESSARRGFLSRQSSTS